MSGIIKQVCRLRIRLDFESILVFLFTWGYFIGCLPILVSPDSITASVPSITALFASTLSCSSTTCFSLASNVSFSSIELFLRQERK